MSGAGEPERRVARGTEPRAGNIPGMTAQPPAVPESDPPDGPGPQAAAKRDRLNGWHIAVSTAVGFAIVAVVLLLSWLLARPNDHSSWADVIRSAVLAVGAIAAVPAGYVAYRKQQTTEKDYEREQAKLAFDQAKEASRQQELTDANDRRIQEIDAANKRADAAAFSDRFTVVADQLGSERAAVRLAGVYAMAQLADDWGRADPPQRQICIDVLCAYLRMPWPAGQTPQMLRTAGDRAAAPRRRLAGRTRPAGAAPLADHRMREEESRVRGTILRVIADHVREDRTRDHWHDEKFDLTSAELPDVALDRCQFRGDFVAVRVTFTGDTDFHLATFSADAMFDGATFIKGASFTAATFSAGAYFIEATFTGHADFTGAAFTSNAWFNDAVFKTRSVFFIMAAFTGAALFDRATFAGAAWFTDAIFTGPVGFSDAFVVGDVDSPGDSLPSKSTGEPRLLGPLLGFPVDVESDDDEIFGL